MSQQREVLQRMSDLEVNTAFAELLISKNAKGTCSVRKYEPTKLEILQDLDVSRCVTLQIGCLIKKFAPCENANDIMPLAFDMKIRLTPYMDIWIADVVTTGVSYADKNPLRAVACLILLIGGAA